MILNILALVRKSKIAHCFSRNRFLDTFAKKRIIDIHFLLPLKIMTRIKTSTLSIRLLQFSLVNQAMAFPQLALNNSQNLFLVD